ncbi:cysteine synthase family protein [Streptomyces sp. NPDC046805]|uniref:cysteine synthase family protein n=1 Tax=Streptomyces sp. NPDC046805 TaxID=3155134 RepID=UPI0033D22654
MPSVLEAMERPRIIHLEGGLYGAYFSLMKVLPACHMLRRGEERGELQPGMRVIETTSGSMGLALAMVSRLRGYACTIVGDQAIDTHMQARLTALGAEVSLVSQPVARGGIQQARLNRVRELQQRHPWHYAPSQYSNPDNPQAYGLAADSMLRAMGEVDCVVGTVGSGGSTCGTTAFLRAASPEVRLVGVDTPGSVLFGAPEGPRLLRGMGSSIRPSVLDPTMFDEVHWVDAPEAFCATRQLYRRHCLFMGGTSGAAYLVARWWAAANPGARVVVLLPDEGFRYQDTVYSDDWLRSQGAYLRQEPRVPVEVSDPGEVGPGWSRMDWKQRPVPEFV